MWHEFVQNREIFILKNQQIISLFVQSVSPLHCIVSALFDLYVVIIYNNHFKRPAKSVAIITLQKLRTIGIMTVFEMNGIRNLCPYPL